MDTTTKPELTEDLISLAESLIISGKVISHKIDAPAEKSHGEEYPYTKSPTLQDAVECGCEEEWFDLYRWQNDG